MIELTRHVVVEKAFWGKFFWSYLCSIIFFPRFTTCFWLILAYYYGEGLVLIYPTALVQSPIPNAAVYILTNYSEGEENLFYY